MGTKKLLGSGQSDFCEVLACRLVFVVTPDLMIFLSWSTAHKDQEVTHRCTKSYFLKATGKGLHPDLEMLCLLNSKHISVKHGVPSMLWEYPSSERKRILLGKGCWQSGKPAQGDRKKRSGDATCCQNCLEATHINDTRNRNPFDNYC